jgi:Xaa-Pro aminopeptidase
MPYRERCLREAANVLRAVVTETEAAAEIRQRPRRSLLGDQSRRAPRLHPKSDDALTPGLVFNVEPVIYIAGYEGIRHCDMVAVAEGGSTC